MVSVHWNHVCVDYGVAEGDEIVGDLEFKVVCIGVTDSKRLECRDGPDIVVCDSGGISGIDSFISIEVRFQIWFNMTYSHPSDLCNIADINTSIPIEISPDKGGNEINLTFCSITLDICSSQVH